MALIGHPQLVRFMITEEYEYREARQLLTMVNGARGNEMAAKRKLSRVKEKLQIALRDIEETEQVKNTGWYVMLKQKEDGSWKCLGCYNPDKTDDIPCEADLIMPIPDPLSVPEFSGF